MCVLNEAEALVENGIPDEPDIEKVVVRRKRTKGKRDLNLQNIEVEVINHDCSEEELREHFPKGWHPMEDEVYKELQYIPARFKVLEHHIKVYAGNSDCGSFLRAKAPERLLAHSILTPELAAAVFNAKYVNAVPLNRLSEEFLRNDVNIPRQDMAGWMIRLSEYYLQPVHDLMKAEIMESHHIHCDETPLSCLSTARNICGCSILLVEAIPIHSSYMNIWVAEAAKSWKISIWISRDTRNRWLPAVSYAYEKK